MEFQEKYASIEHGGKPKEIIRTNVDENISLVIYDDVIDRYSDELRIFLKNSKTDEILLDFSALNLFLNKDKTSSDVIIVEADEFVCKISPPTVGVPAKAFHDPKEIFGLLHELGHVEMNRRKHQECAKKTTETISSSKNPDADESALRIKEERDAWAQAIKYARKIKKEYGVNLFKPFGSIDEFMGWLRVTGLRSYEDLAEKWSGEQFVTKEKQVDLWLKKESAEFKKKLLEELKNSEELKGLF